MHYEGMTYNKLQSILPNDEIHYISDSTQFFIDNQIKSKQFKVGKIYQEKFNEFMKDNVFD